MLDARFSLEPESRSVRVLIQYLEKQAAKNEVTKKYTSPTTSSPTSTPSGTTSQGKGSSFAEPPPPPAHGEVALAAKDDHRATEILKWAKANRTEDAKSLPRNHKLGAKN